MWTSTWMHWVLLVDRTRWPTPAWTSCSKSPLHLLLQPVSSRLQFILSLSAWLTRLQLRLHDWKTMKMILFAHTHTQSHEHSQARTCMHIQACMRTHHNTHSLSLHLSQSFPSPPICSIMFLLVCTRKSDWSVGFLLVMLAAKVQDCWHCHSKSILFKGTVLLMLIIVIIPCQLCNYQKTRVK